MNNWLPLIMLLLLIPMFLATIFTPYWTRRTESFGVTIPKELYVNKELKKKRKQFATYTSLIAIVLTTIFFLVSWNANEEMLSVSFTVMTLLYLILSFFIYLKFHVDMKKLKENSNWGKEKSQQVFVSTNFHNEKLNYSNWWFLISFIITFGMAIFTLKNYALLPEQIPMQYSFSGEVTNWAEKSYRSALMLPIMQLYMTVLFIFINAMIAKAKQQIDADNPKDSMKRNTLFRRRWSLYIIITGNGLALLFAFIQLSFFYQFNQQVMMIVPLIFALVLVAGAIYLSYSTGQGGSRIGRGMVIEDNKTINRDDDRYWKLGIFYFNPADPALFLEKRFGIGWTINLARPLAWIIFIIIFGGIILIPLLLS